MADAELSEAVEAVATALTRQGAIRAEWAFFADLEPARTAWLEEALRRRTISRQ